MGLKNVSYIFQALLSRISWYKLGVRKAILLSYFEECILQEDPRKNFVKLITGCTTKDGKG